MNVLMSIHISNLIQRRNVQGVLKRVHLAPLIDWVDLRDCIISFSWLFVWQIEVDLLNLFLPQVEWSHEYVCLKNHPKKLIRNMQSFSFSLFKLCSLYKLPKSLGVMSQKVWHLTLKTLSKKATFSKNAISKANQINETCLVALFQEDFGPH